MGPQVLAACTRHAHSKCGLEMLQMIQFVALALLHLALGRIGRTATAEHIRSPCSQPGFAEQLKITGPLADDVAGASSPPAAPSHGRAYRTCREQRYGPIDHY